MNTELYIAKKILKNRKGNRKISKPIVFLSIMGITLGIMVMLLSISITSGFQREIREKIVGFGSHIQVYSSYNNQSFETSPLLIKDIPLQDINNDKSVNKVHIFAYKPAILQVREETEGVRDILGVVFKGVSYDFNREFFKKHLKKGKIPTFNANKTNDSIVISRYVSNKLKLKINDKISSFFIKNEGPKRRNLIISGIYETGLEDFDKQFCFIDINHIRKLNEWGISTFLTVKENCEYGFVVLQASVFGGNGNYRYSWNNKPYSVEKKQILCPIKDTIIQLVATDFESNSYLEPEEPKTIPDTAWVTIKTQEKIENCYCNEKNTPLLPNYINDSVTVFNINGKIFTTTIKTSGGSAKHYSGGIEVLLNKFENLEKGEDIIEQYVGPQFNVATITQQHEEIFNWLEMIDMNVYIIIGLMIVVAIINMTSALLVLILEKTQMIGILKSLGATNWSIRKIFVYNGAYLIIKGILYGNILAFIIIFLQKNYSIITLPQENYYVSVVPMDFPILFFIIVNVGAFIICYLALILPSYIVTKISPIKAIKFE